MAEESLKDFVSNNDKDSSLAYTRVYGAFKVGISNKESTEYYNNWAGKYDEECQKSVHYSGPIFARRALEKYYDSDVRDKITIIDIAAGTGYVAEELQKCGFKIMDALDPSEGMLSVARDKNLYRNYICAYLEKGKTPIKDDEYDCLVVAGGMGEGHIPCSGLYDMIRIVKPGGLVCIVLREEFLSYVEEYKDKLEPLMDQLEKDGKWKRISREVFPNYTFNKDGVTYMYEVC